MASCDSFAAVCFRFFILQSLLVSLLNPSGGAQFGGLTSVTLTILKNDDFNGAFSLASDSVVVGVDLTQAL